MVFSALSTFSPLHLASQLWLIFYYIVFPILAIAGLGYIIQRRMKLDMATLTRLNFYFVVPVLIYYSVVTSKLTARDFGKVILFCVAMLCLLAAVSHLAARLRRIPPNQRGVLLMTSMFYNSGNYGLPLQDLAFRNAGLSDAAMALQVFVMVTQNFTNFTFGILLATSGQGNRHWHDNVRFIVRFPPIYALAAALLTVQVRNLLGSCYGPEAVAHVAAALQPFWDVIRYIREAFIAVALVTLGAQLALLKQHKQGYPVGVAVILRLLGGPALGLGLILLSQLTPPEWGLRLSGFLAQVLLISTTTPTAVNTMLLCLQFDNHPEFAARSVFYSTLLSPLTVTLTIFIAQSGLLPLLY